MAPEAISLFQAVQEAQYLASMCVTKVYGESVPASLLSMASAVDWVRGFLTDHSFIQMFSRTSSDLIPVAECMVELKAGEAA